MAPSFSVSMADRCGKVVDLEEVKNKKGHKIKLILVHPTSEKHTKTLKMDQDMAWPVDDPSNDERLPDRGAANETLLEADMFLNGTEQEMAEVASRVDHKVGKPF